MSPGGFFPARGASGNRQHLVLHALGGELRPLAHAALRGAGFRTTPAGSLRELLALLRSEMPDAILLDDAAGGNGLSLCREVRRTADGAELPIFVLLSEGGQRAVEDAFEAGATDVVPPPISWTLLTQRLARCLSTWRLLNRLREDRFSLEEAKRNALAASDAMLRLKHYDDLTGLPNRTLFTDFLGLALARAERDGKQIAVLFLDIDGFKEINETLGRQRGDELLRQIGKRLRRSLRSGDTLARERGGDDGTTSVARLSGDEFVILMNEVNDRAAVERVGRRLIEAMAGPFAIQQKKLHLTSCIGVVLAPEDGSGEDALLQRAETAMYHAKSKGPGTCLFFDSSMKSAAVHKLEIKLGLRRALEEDQLVLHYQPLVDAGGGITGLEALVRWQHPERGLLAPDEFVPIAEDTGLMVPIGDWVLREACRQLGRWREQGIELVPVSVNVASSQLEQPDFARGVLAVLAEHGTEPGLLKLELSERAVLRDDPRLLGQLEELRDGGVQLAIDDFGTGQTSLTYLRRFPFDVIKIDRSFVVGLTRDEDDDAIAAAIIAMARKLNLVVVAEGVETEAQAGFLRSQGCDELQGFLFHRPLPAARVAELVRAPAAAAIA